MSPQQLKEKKEETLTQHDIVSLAELKASSN